MHWPSERTGILRVKLKKSSREFELMMVALRSEKVDDIIRPPRKNVYRGYVYKVKSRRYDFGTREICSRFLGKFFT